MKRAEGAPRAKRTAPKGPKRERPPIVFSGPSVSHAEVLDVLPGAETRPPIRRGDLDSLQQGRVVAIIDGVFDAVLAVSPSEIRAALARGVRIYGSSSMGALRASEVPEVEGVGRIYEMYRGGRILRDDEVAVLVDTESGKSLTEPLVNVRYAVEQLTASGSISRTTGAAIVDAASAMHFHDRTYPNILRRAGVSDANAAAILMRALRAFDLKRDDAVTLLERLRAIPREKSASASLPKSNGTNEIVADDLVDVRVKAVEHPDAPLRVWEFGEVIDFRELLRFLALTGRLEDHVRRILGRSALSEGTAKPWRRLDKRAPDPQELFEAAWDEWGWQTEEEVHVTFHDLGVGMKAFSRHMSAEHDARSRIAWACEKMPNELLRSLRTELLCNNLALKREAMRYGSLLKLAARARTSPSTGDLIEAKAALLGSATYHMTVDKWTDLLDRVCLSEEQALSTVDLVARARQYGVERLAEFEAASTVSGSGGIGTEALDSAQYGAGSSRSVDDGEAMSIATRLGRVIGITRVAQLSELERMDGLHVAAAYRPSGWSSTIGSGKSESADGAIVGAIMEEMEKYCCDAFEPEVVRTQSFNEWGAGEAVSAFELSTPYDSPYTEEQPIDWTWADDLVSGTRIHVPASIWSPKRRLNDPWFCPRLGRKQFNSNGNAAAFTVTEALCHALSELIERHAVKLAEQAIANPGNLPGALQPPFHFVDLKTCPVSTQRICTAIQLAGFSVRVLNITSEIAVPTFMARIGFRAQDPDVDDEAAKAAVSACTHPNPEIAINRAMLEGVQDIIQNVSGAREDFAIRVRSLGRHERPRPRPRGAYLWLRPGVPKKKFAASWGVRSTSGRDDLRFIVERLTAASYGRVLYRDISSEVTKPVAAVRAMIPGLETPNPFSTGLRARMNLVTDLLRKHEW